MSSYVKLVTFLFSAFFLDWCEQLPHQGKQGLSCRWSFRVGHPPPPLSHHLSSSSLNSPDGYISCYRFFSGVYGLWVDGDLNRGRTRSCTTYNNDQLTVNEDFTIRNLEIWTFE